MSERSSTKKPRDLNALGAAISAEATGEPPPEEPDDRDPVAVALGSKDGAKGGPARTKALTAERRREIVHQAALVRWVKDDGVTEP